MKRFCLVFLAIGLIAAFSTSVFAVDVKFSGEYYAAGLYLDKTTVQKDTAVSGPSTAFFYQRLRIRTDFVVSRGLKLVTRLDAMERAWGAARSIPAAATMADSTGTAAENENIAFDWAYLEYESPVGRFTVGYLDDNTWGTVFANNAAPAGTLMWGNLFFGKFWPFIKYVKVSDNSRTAINPALTSDRDNDKILAGLMYFGKDVEAGAIFVYMRYASGRLNMVGPFDYGNQARFYTFQPYVKAKFGPVRVEAEIDYGWGSYPEFDNPYLTGAQNAKLDNKQAYVNAVADFGYVYAGGAFAYVSGNDPGTKDKVEGGMLNGGRDFNPCLIMFNSSLTDWSGFINGYNGSQVGRPMSNAWFFQLKTGVKPMDKLDISASVSYANADKKPSAAWLYNDYGYEVDLTATYKITNNLSYMLGGGYLFTGKYYKGTSELNNVANEYLLINKLTLTF